MCGEQVSQGILCAKCDKPRRPKTTATTKAAADPVTPPPAAPPAAPPPAAPAQTSPHAAAPTAAAPRTEAPPARSATATAPAIDHDPFPKAPVVPFPVGAASLAVTSIVDLLVATGVAAAFLAPDRSVKFVSEDARALFGVGHSELSLQTIESRTGIRIGDLSVPATAAIRIGERNLLYSLVPLSGGAAGAVLVFRPADASTQSHASFTSFVREAVFAPLRALRDLTIEASRTRGRGDPLLDDVAATVEQVLSSLELAPEVSDSGFAPLPTVVDVVHQVVSRYGTHADLKGIKLQVDAQELEERFRDHERLAECLGILMDNALQYVPVGGQIVIGVRWMEYKGKPLLLFFVMDNGPIVPEALRHSIFEPDFAWNPSSPERTGRGLFKTREFALAHAGSVWVEARSGKACTFFLRVRPDGAI